VRPRQDGSREPGRRRFLAKSAWVVVAALVVFVGGREVAVLTHSSAQASATPPPAAPAPAASAGVPTHTSPSAHGAITAIDGDHWTIVTTNRSTVTVLLSGQTRFGTATKPAAREDFPVGTHIAVTGARSGDSVHADRITIAAAAAGSTTPTPTATTPTTTPTPHPTPTPTAAPSAPVVATSCPVGPGLSQALAYASSRGERASLAVYDTATGTYTAAGDSDSQYSSASVVKVFIATDLLLTDQMHGDTASTAYQMITASDDDATDNLYGLVGGDSVITTIAAHYGITNLGSPPADTGQWGETKITADGLVHLYAQLKTDPAVWPWLSQAMANTTRDGTDGTDQFFGIPSASQDWAVKQGWMTGLGPGSVYNTTGYVDDTRYAVVILSYGSVSEYGQYMSSTITQMARDVLPGGVPGGTSTPCGT